MYVVMYGLRMGSIVMMPTVTLVPLARSRPPAGSRVITSHGVVGYLQIILQHRRGCGLEAFIDAKKSFLHHIQPYVRTHVPKAWLERANCN